MTPTHLTNVPQNRGYKIQDNAGGHGPFIGVYADYNEATGICTVTATLEVGNRTYNYYSGTYVEVFDGPNGIMDLSGSKIYPGSPRIVLQKTVTYNATGECEIWARFSQDANGTHEERWHFSTDPIRFNCTVTPDAPSNDIRWDDGTYYDGGSRNCGVFRLYNNDDKNKLQHAFIARSAVNAINIKNELWRENQLIKTSEDDFDIYFTESDRGKLFTLKSCSISSTNTTVSGNDICWYINDLPKMDPQSVYADVTRTKDYVTLNWGRATDSLNKDNKITYRVHIRKKDSKGNYITDNIIEVPEGNISQIIQLSKYGIEKGESAYLSVEPGDYLEHSYQLYGNVKVTRNSAPYFTKGSSIHTNVDAEPYIGLFRDNVKISWNSAFDKENDKLKYLIYYSINKNRANPSWSSWQQLPSYATTNLFNTISCQSYVGKGEQIKFGIVVNDGLESSCENGKVSITSNVLTRDIEPLPPTAYTLYPKKDNEIHYETITKFEWNSSLCLNKKPCEIYLVEIWTGSENDKKKTQKIFANNIKSTYMYYDISKIPRGHYFFFKVYSIDIYGLMSLTHLESKMYRRNQAPKPVQNFRVNSSKKNFYKTVPLIWDKGSDPDNDPITYTIYFSRNNNNNYEIIASGLTQLTYSHDISKLQPNDKLNYKIIAVDKFNVPSNENSLKNSGNIVVNTKPETPTLLYPISGVYDSTPRILFKTTGDKNNDNLLIKIKINGSEYNCATSNQFNKKLYLCNDDKIIFIPPVLKEGNNTITIKANDGYEDSIEKSYNIIYKKPLLDDISNNNTYITTNIYYNLFTMVNDTLKAYGRQQLSKPTISKDKSYITADNFYLLYSGIRSVTYFININFPGKNREMPIANIAKGIIVSKNMYNTILHNIKNI